MAPRHKMPEAASSNAERQWTKRLRCLEAALRRAPQLPATFSIQNADAVTLEWLFTLVASYNQTTRPFDLRQQQRFGEARITLAGLEASWHKRLGQFGQRYALSPALLLQIVNLIEKARPWLAVVNELSLTSDGLLLHAILTGQGQPNLDDWISTAEEAGALGLVVHEADQGALQISFSFALTGPRTSRLGFKVQLRSTSARGKSLPAAV